jgi:hypothetical protein
MPNMYTLPYYTHSYKPVPVISLKRNGMIGSTNLQRKKIKIRIKNMEYLSKPWRTLLIFGGKIEKRIFEPSSGGIGRRLNTAKIIFIDTIYAQMTKKDWGKLISPKRIISPKTNAMRILDAGPAAAIRNSPILRFFIL